MTESEKYFLDTMLFHIVYCRSFQEIALHEEPSPVTFDTSITFECSCGFRTRYYEDPNVSRSFRRKYEYDNNINSERLNRDLFNMIRCGSAKACNKCFLELVNDYYRENKDILRERRMLDEIRDFDVIQLEDELKKRIELVGRKMRQAILSLEV